MRRASIRFKFDEQKAAAAAGHLLELAGGKMPYLSLIKLLYLAERESLRQRGWPIFGDQYVSMEHGPVVSRVYDLIKAEDLPSDHPWVQHISEPDEKYVVGLKTAPDLGVLSDADVEILVSVFRVHQSLGPWRLRDLTHLLPEWTNPGRTSRPIPVEEVLRVLGKSDEEIDEIRRQAAENGYFDELFTDVEPK